MCPYLKKCVFILSDLVFIIPVGLWDMREVVESGDIVPGFRAVLRVLASMEREIELSAERLGKPVNQVNIIFDFQQFSYRQISSRTVCQGAIEFFRIFEANYPEIMKLGMFINTPRIFPIFFAILKPFLSSKTLGKMEFHGQHRNKWISVLEKKLPMEIMPPHYGGTREGADEFCSDSGIWNDEVLSPNYYKADARNRRRGSILDVVPGRHFKQDNNNFMYALICASAAT
jgi:hypothetical protein